MSDTPEATPKTPIEARDEFLAYIMAKPEAERDAILYAADKLLEVVMRPNMLNAFALVNAELAALHYEGKLSAPEIAKIGGRIRL